MNGHNDIIYMRYVLWNNLNAIIRWKNVHQSLFKSINERSICWLSKRDAGVIYSGTRPENRLLLQGKCQRHKTRQTGARTITDRQSSEWYFTGRKNRPLDSTEQHGMTLKKQIEQHELRIVSLDVPTSWQALSDLEASPNDPITRAVIADMNNMLIDLMAAMSHKNWLSPR